MRAQADRSGPGVGQLLRAVSSLRRVGGRVTPETVETIALRIGRTPAQVQGIVGLTSDSEGLSPSSAPPLAIDDAVPFGVARDVLAQPFGVDPWSFDAVVDVGGYGGYRRTLAATVAEVVIEDLKRSRFQERRGECLPVGLKWQLAAEAPGDDVQLVCVVDLRDSVQRAVARASPHRMLEGLGIAANAVGATSAWVCVEGGDDTWLEALEAAVRSFTGAAARWRAEAVGRSPLTVEVVDLCGVADPTEETALLSALEDRRGTPRPRPPYPTRRGLLGRPTIIHDVETWAGISDAISDGGSVCTVAAGTDRKMIEVAGAVDRPGVHEMALGDSWRGLIATAGGPAGRIAALHVGGHFGSFVPSSLLDQEFDFASLRALGATVGPCRVEVIAEEDELVERMADAVEVAYQRSCGACPPCRIGGRVLVGMARSVAEGRVRAGDLDRLAVLAAHVTSSSMCRVGCSLPRPIMSMLTNFRDVMVGSTGESGVLRSQ